MRGNTLPAGTHARYGEKAQLLHHPNIVAVREVLGDLTSADLHHVDVLNLEVAAGGFDTHKDTVTERDPADAAMRSAEHSSHRHPFPLTHVAERRKADIGKGHLNVLQNCEYARPTHWSSMVACILGEKLACPSHVTAVEYIPLLLNQPSIAFQVAQFASFSEGSRVHEAIRLAVSTVSLRRPFRQ